MLHGSAQGCRLVYLLSRYPAISHTFFQNEVRELRRLGFSIEVASINPSDRPRSKMTAAEAEESDHTYYIKSTGKVQVLRTLLGTLFGHPRVFFRGLTAALRLKPGDLFATLYGLFYFVEALLLGRWMRKKGYRHFHVHFGGPVATVGMLTSIAWEIPYSIMFHGPEEFYDVDSSYLAQKIEHAKFIFCISNFCRSQIMKITSPEHWAKLQVIRLGVHPEIFTPNHRQPSEDGIIEIACVGRLVPAKGQLILLQACAKLLEQGAPLRLRLIGDGPDRKHLESFVLEQGITSSVVFEGSRNHDETRRLLGGADIFALASFAEGVPVALMEAMAMEIPCVSTYVAGIPELIRDGLEGLLVPASSPTALAEAIERLITEPHLRESLGKSGRKRVLELYNLPENVLSLAAAFEKELAPRAIPV